MTRHGMTLFYPAATKLPAAMTSAYYMPKNAGRIAKIGRTGVLRPLCHRKIGQAALGSVRLSAPSAAAAFTAKSKSP